MLVCPLVRALVCAILVAFTSMLNPAQAGVSDFTASDGVKLSYHEQGGGGRTLIFVPGWTMPAAIWKPQLDFFARTHRVIAFDPRGQGDSDIASAGYTPERRAQDIAELIAAARADQPVIIGWSLAVLEALAYVKLHGDERHAGLVLVDNSVGEEPPPVQKFDIIAALRKDRERTVRNFVRGMFKTPQPAAYLEGISRASLKTPLGPSIELLSYGWPRTQWREALYATRKPVLYVVTSQFAEQAANVKKNRPDITVEVFRDAGHAMFIDEPQRFNAVVERFLVQIDSTR
jgi:non-heme chloroperoxidase